MEYDPKFDTTANLILAQGPLGQPQVAGGALLSDLVALFVLQSLIKKDDTSIVILVERAFRFANEFIAQRHARIQMGHAIKSDT